MPARGNAPASRATTSWSRSTTTAAATVNGEKIPAQTLVNAWQERQSQLQQQLRDELPPELVKSEQRKLVEDYIDRELLVQRANESGYRVSDRELAQALTQINRLIDQQAFTRAVDDIFLGSATVFLLLIGTIWLTERPARHAGVGAADAGGAH